MFVFIKNHLYIIAFTTIGLIIGLILLSREPITTVFRVEYTQHVQNAEQIPTILKNDTLVKVNEHVLIRNFTTSISDTNKNINKKNGELKIYSKVKLNDEIARELANNYLKSTNATVYNVRPRGQKRIYRIVFYYFVCGLFIGILFHVLFIKKRVTPRKKETTTPI